MISKNPQQHKPAAATSRGAIVFGGAHGSLAVIRNLGRQGIPVWFLAHDNLIAKYSRYTRRCIAWPGPSSPDAIDFLCDLAKRHDLAGWTLFPGGDCEAQLVAENHATLSRCFQLVTPSWKIMRMAQDKRLMYAHANELNIDHPWMYNPEDAAQAQEASKRFPFVIKPAIGNGDDALSKAKAWRIDNESEMAQRYAQAVEMLGRENVVVQEMIPGGGSTQFSYAAVYNQGKPVASLVARRTRQYPIEFGYTSTFVETIENQEIENAASRFLQSLNYTGMVEIEFKHDARDNRYKILDINTRTWTWIGLGAAAGVNFPWVIWQVAAGIDVPVQRGRSGVGWCHLSRDAIAALHHITKGSLSIRNYLKFINRKSTFAAFAFDDPLPGLMDLPLLVPRLIRRVFFSNPAPKPSRMDPTFNNAK